MGRAFESAQALADVATIAILQHRATLEAQVLNEQLNQALNSRIVIEQAKGIIAQREGLDMEQAFAEVAQPCRATTTFCSRTSPATSSPESWPQPRLIVRPEQGQPDSGRNRYDLARREAPMVLVVRRGPSRPAAYAVTPQHVWSAVVVIAAFSGGEAVEEHAGSAANIKRGGSGHRRTSSLERCSGEVLGDDAADHRRCRRGHLAPWLRLDGARRARTIILIGVSINRASTAADSA